MSQTNDKRSNFPSYCFILGFNHSLCKAEIISVLDRKNITFQIIESSQEVLLINTEQDLETAVDINDFGSTVKIAKLYPRNETLEIILENKNDRNLLDFLNPAAKPRQFFSLSVYGGNCKFKQLNEAWYKAPRIAKKLRNYLLENQIGAGFLPTKERQVSSVMIDKHKILSGGFDLVLIVSCDRTYFGKTIAIQDYKNYSLRDFGRPDRNPKSGMIPPKLAKIMLNLARKKTSAVVLDPFCGSGTILNEMWLLHYQNIIGADISDRAIISSKTNLEWLAKKFPQENLINRTIKFIRTDVNEISHHLSKNSIDAIITEPFLGSESARKFNFERLKEEIAAQEKFYLSVFQQFFNILSEDGKIVIVFPIFRSANDFLTLNILDKIKTIGFNVENFLPPGIKEETKLLNLQITLRGSIVYFRPDQTISREIFIFSKTSG